MDVVVLNCRVTATNEIDRGVKGLNQFCKIRERPRESVDLVDHHNVDFAGLDIGLAAFSGLDGSRLPPEYAGSS